MTRMQGIAGGAEGVAERLEFAIAAAKEAAASTLELFHAGGITVDLKADATPVTEADRNCERLLRERILAAFPGDGVIGEEFGEHEGTSGVRWILDPIDGTKSFIRGVPLYGCLVAAEWDRGDRWEPLVGVIEMPALDERVWAAHGQGAWWQRRQDTPRRAQVSTCARLADACVCTTSLGYFEDAGLVDTYLKLSQRSLIVRGWSDCYASLLCATGRCDAVVEPSIKVWDVAPMLPIMREAGGIYCGFSGREDIREPAGLLATPGLRDELLALLAE